MAVEASAAQPLPFRERVAGLRRPHTAQRRSTCATSSCLRAPRVKVDGALSQKKVSWWEQGRGVGAGRARRMQRCFFRSGRALFFLWNFIALPPPPPPPTHCASTAVQCKGAWGHPPSVQCAAGGAQKSMDVFYSKKCFYCFRRQFFLKNEKCHTHQEKQI